MTRDQQMKERLLAAVCTSQNIEEKNHFQMLAELALLVGPSELWRMVHRVNRSYLAVEIELDREQAKFERGRE